MELKKFFQPKWYVYLILIAFLIAEFLLLKNAYTSIGPGSCLNNGCDPEIRILSREGIIFAGMFLIPIVLVYTLISLIVLVIDKTNK